VAVEVSATKDAALPLGGNIHPIWWLPPSGRGLSLRVARENGWVAAAATALAT
jgi:hypothetical protein